MCRVYYPSMTIGVYGLGRFGAFWASCLSNRFTVKAFSRNPDRVCPPGVTRVGEQEVLACEAIFLCVTISALETVLRRIAEKLPENTVVMDTCSVKVFPVEAMTRHLPDTAQLIGTHPMFGPDSGQNGIEGLPLVFCPIRVTSKVSDFWRQEFVSLGLSVHVLSPEEHDREAAYTQGVTHFMGRVLDDLQLEPSRISTVGYTKLLEIIEQTCNDPFQLFVDLQRYNPFTGEMRARLAKTLQKMQDLLS